MSALNLRLTPALKSEAAAYAKTLGISLNALVAVAVRDYLDARKAVSGSMPAAASPALAGEVARASTAGRSPEAADSGKKPAAEAVWRAAAARVGRNDPCPCGSGKKAKQCHRALAVMP